MKIAGVSVIVTAVLTKTGQGPPTGNLPRGVRSEEGLQKP